MTNNLKIFLEQEQEALEEIRRQAQLRLITIRSALRDSYIECSGTEAGFSNIESIAIAVEAIVRNGGIATITQIYDVFEEKMNERECTMSEQAKDSLRRLVNKKAVDLGVIQMHGKKDGWKLRPPDFGSSR
jgi:hypothetical protein